MKIEIGNKPLKNLTAKNILDIVIIEKHTLSLEHWDVPELMSFDNTMFPNTIVIDYFFIRKEDKIRSVDFTFFFNYKELTMHSIKNHNHKNNISSSRVRLETLRYLIKEGFDIPLYE